MRFPLPDNRLLLFLFSLFCFPHNCIGQRVLELRFTLVQKNVTIEYVFGEIQQQTGLIFGFSNDLFYKDQRVDVDFRRALLKDVLNQLLGEKGFEWQLEGTQIIVKEKLNRHSLLVSSPKKRRLVLRDTTFQEDLDEQVVPGYNLITQRTGTGNVAAVKKREIKMHPVENAASLLQGQIPGLMVWRTGGMFGTEMNIQVRGQVSLSGGTVPLFIVDGIPYNPRMTEGLGSGIWGALASTLGYINPAEIESIEVLKDADATAIYGSRGANGVIIITTKRGRKGPFRIDVNVNYGLAMVPRKYDLMNTREYLGMRQEGFINDNVLPTIQNAPDLLKWDTTRYTDWQKSMVGGIARNYNAQVAVSGGNDTLYYYAGGSFHREGTVFPGAFNNQQLGFHFSATYGDSSKRFHGVAMWSYLDNKSLLPAIDFINYSFLAPNAPAGYNKDGTLNYDWVNPYIALLGPLFTADIRNRMANVVLNCHLNRQLQFKVMYGDQLLKGRSKTIVPLTVVAPAIRGDANGAVTYATYSTASRIIEPQILYTGKLKELNITALTGTTFQYAPEEHSTISASGYKDDDHYDNPAYAAIVKVRENKVNYRYLAAYTRIGFKWKDEYLLNFNIRRDGSSRFGERRKYATFGSVGAAWIFTEMKSLNKVNSVLSFGKLRASYGTTGNDQLGDYQYLSQYTATAGTYQGVTGAVPYSLANPDFAWELTRKMEVQLDLGFWNDRWLVSACYYIYKTSNLITSKQLPLVTGTANILGNEQAEIKNEGWEFTMRTQHLETRNFSWSSSFNLSIPRNKLIAYPGSNTNSNYLLVGKPLTAIYVYHVLGVDKNTGEYLFSDANVHPVSASGNAVRTYMVNPAPVLFGGIQHTFKFKTWQLDINMLFVQQPGVDDLNDRTYVPGMQRNMDKRAVYNHWIEDSDNALHQRYSVSGSIRSGYLKMLESDRNYRDASFIKCKSLTLAKMLPVKRFHLHDAYVYVQADNLFTITAYPGLDPETQRRSAIPVLRSISAGIQVQL